ncbi:MAG: PEP-CTERM sorting domain-containing protein, partial [Planctomycetales bacterium]|nr:PEP-CTERM sorting domain-containing protein [Planctomycetales bacterium]
NAPFYFAEGGLMGLSFPIGGGTENELHYAWIRVDIDNAAGSFVIREWAYESEAGVGIAAGDTGTSSLPGDFVVDGIVDGFDFLAWQRERGVTLGAADLASWEASFGAAASAAHAVPEAGSLGLLAAGSLGLASLRRRRASRVMRNAER